MKRYIGFILCLTTIIGYTQTDPEKKIGSWYMLHGTHRISEKLSINTGVQLRYYEFISNYNLDFFYTGINYHRQLNTTFSFNAGYLDIDRSIEVTGVKNTIEYRFFEQISHQHLLATIPIDHRIRMEHRFRHVVENNAVQNRLRYRLGAKIKLNKTLFLVANNEFFWNFKDHPFTENRIYSGLGIKVNKPIKLQLGFMKQYINNLHLDRLQIGITIATDLRKKTLQVP